MCDIEKRYRTKKQVTGYKVAINYKGNYHSPLSGIKYTIGKVPISEVIEKYRHNYEEIKQDEKNVGEDINYTPGMKGKTGVILSKADAKSLLNDLERRYGSRYNFTMLKMTIQGGLRKASFGWDDYRIIIGREILSIKRIS